MKRHVLGQGLEVSAFGIGCNAMADENYGRVDEAESLRTLHAALDIGVDFWDTSETYGRNHGNEILLGKVIAERRDEVIIATKSVIDCAGVGLSGADDFFGAGGDDWIAVSDAGGDEPDVAGVAGAE